MEGLFEERGLFGGVGLFEDLRYTISSTRNFLIGLL